MRFEGLDLNLLVVFESLLETGNVTQSARQLNISQPSVSAALGRLRDYFQDDLFVHVDRRMQPTAKAESLAPGVAEMLNVARFRVCRPERFDPATSRRRFRLIASDYAFDTLVGRTIARVARQAPGLLFEVNPAGSESYAAFQKGDIDLLLTVPDFVLADHPQEMLFADTDAVVCWNESRFAKGVTAEDFMNAEFAAAVFGAERRPTVSEIFFRKIGIYRKIVVEVPSFSALPAAIVGTDRLAVMHARHARLFARLYPISLHPLPVQSANIKEIAQWHRLRGEDPGVQWLLQRLKEEVSLL